MRTETVQGLQLTWHIYIASRDAIYVREKYKEVNNHISCE